MIALFRKKTRLRDVSSSEGNGVVVRMDFVGERLKGCLFGSMSSSDEKMKEVITNRNAPRFYLLTFLHKILS